MSADWPLSAAVLLGLAAIRPGRRISLPPPRRRLTMSPTSTGSPPFRPTASTKSGRASGISAGCTSRFGLHSYYLGKGLFYSPAKWVHIWGGLIAVYTDSTVKSNSLELRPFVGPKFVGSNSKKWRYFNWTRYELRLTETLDTDEWKTVHRVRNQTRIEIPLAAGDRAWTPKSCTCCRTSSHLSFRHGQIDPLRVRVGLGYVASQRVLVEFHYFVQYTRPDSGGLAYTDNILRLNFKIALSRGISLARLLDGGVDD